jgi:hypothetical protein
MSDVQTFLPQVLNTQALNLSRPKPRNRRQHIGKAGALILPFDMENCLNDLWR